MHPQAAAVGDAQCFSLSLLGWFGVSLTSCAAVTEVIACCLRVFSCAERDINFLMDPKESEVFKCSSLQNPQLLMEEKC